jgi:hypothetical protein
LQTVTTSLAFLWALRPVTVVSDTSPISYLVLIGREEVIAELFGEVLVPRQSASSWLIQRVRTWFESEFPGLLFG